MVTSRQRIIEFIDKNQAVTAADISQSLNVTEANIRHHLSILLKNGLIKIIGKKPPRGKGRPSYIYCLSDKFVSETLEMILSAILSEIRAPNTSDITGLLSKVAKRIATVNHDQVKDGFPDHSKPAITRRLLFAVDRLQELNYRPHWEAHVDGPKIILGNCPYLNIPVEHPEFCQLDKFIIEQLVSNPVQQTVKLEQDERKIPYCIFQVSLRND